MKNLFVAFTSSSSRDVTAFVVLILSIRTSSSSPSGSSGFGKTSLLLGEILKSKWHKSDRFPVEKLCKSNEFSVYYNQSFGQINKEHNRIFILKLSVLCLKNSLITIKESSGVAHIILDFYLCFIVLDGYDYFFPPHNELAHPLLQNNFEIRFHENGGSKHLESGMAPETLGHLIIISMFAQI